MNKIDTAEPQGAERRRAPRHPLDLEIICRTLGTGGGTSWPAMVKDISTSGIGLLVRRSFAPGTVLSVELPDTDSILGRSITVRVVHSRTAGEGQWLAGCLFATQLEADELQKWVASFSPGKRAQAFPSQEKTESAFPLQERSAPEQPSQETAAPGVSLQETAAPTTNWLLVIVILCVLLGAVGGLELGLWSKRAAVKKPSEVNIEKPENNKEPAGQAP